MAGHLLVSSEGAVSHAKSLDLQDSRSLLRGAVREAFTPNVVAPGANTAQDGLRINRRRHRLMDPQPEGHFEPPTVCARAAGKIGSGGVERDGI